MKTYHAENEFVVKSQKKREQEVDTKPGKFEVAGDGVFVIEVGVLGGLRLLASGRFDVDIEVLDLAIAGFLLLRRQERDRLLVICRGHFGRL